MEPDGRVLSLFPLNTVLFPHMELPLQVFEERYQQMIAACLEGDRTFGVVLIKSGMEVGGPAEPHEVGTTAVITDVRPLADGRMALAVTGQQRFQILEIIQERPYLVARVALLKEEGDPASLASVVGTVRELAHTCRQKALALNGEWVRRVRLPHEPDALSFLVAQRLPVALPVKQRLLAAPTVAERLTQEIPLLEQERERLERLILTRQWVRNDALN
ncbi:MAG: LON peptidase substrate-binding domain-containing protein [Chloroflexi bacterium]|nr:LON peptidase substrate-binding domain-containing protein [Chloroflexota bacterium]